MSDEMSLDVSFYSPRFGSNQSYDLRLDRDEMTFKSKGKVAVCTWVENRDPEWSGHLQDIGNPLVKILENDSIYPPSSFVGAVEYLWTSWRSEELTDDKVQAEIESLSNWVNASSQNQPDTEFWKGFMG